MKFIRSASAAFWREVIAIALAWAGIITAIYPALSDSFWFPTLLATVSGFSLAGIVLAVKDEQPRQPVASGKPEEIIEYNEQWLAEQGAVVVVTRDMSWILSGNVKSLLEKKASGGDLTLIAASQSPTLESLQNLGAQVIFAQRVPRVRFTVLRYGSSDARVLVHRQISGKVVFHEYDRTAFPIYDLCMDLISEFLETTSRRK